MRLSQLIRKIKDCLFGAKSPARIMEERIEALRRRGVRIGEDCRLYTTSFSTEPYLVELGNRVAISGDVKFITHDASVWLIRPKRPRAQVFGRIRVGDGTFIGESCLILPGTTIGAGCVIAAGSVVRGNIPDNSIAIGNPARVVGRASLLKSAHERLNMVLDTRHLPEPEREAAIRRHFGL
jgi:acetyltransferase-like isoleucine patch superfamily enzyme